MNNRNTLINKTGRIINRNKQEFTEITYKSDNRVSETFELLNINEFD